MVREAVKGFVLLDCTELRLISLISLKDTEILRVAFITFFIGEFNFKAIVAVALRYIKAVQSVLCTLRSQVT